MKYFLLNSPFLKLLIDLILLPFVTFGAPFFFAYRRVGSQHLQICTKVLKKIGVFPIIDHFYEPCFKNVETSDDVYMSRQLPGIDFNISNQLKLISKLNFNKEFEQFLLNEKNVNKTQRFDWNNGYFESGDAEFLFQIVRYLKPKRIIEIGSGESTKIINAALKINQELDKSKSMHTCIDPNAGSFIEDVANIKLIKSNVEEVDIELFKSLDVGDLLFIDSSHMIRPRGDVLFEYLEVIPQLKNGVICHVHDIFSPRDYPNEWLQEKVLFWNEQYLLEALLSHTNKYQIVAALNYLKHNHYEELLRVAPFLTRNREPASFYFKII